MEASIQLTILKIICLQIYTFNTNKNQQMKLIMEFVFKTQKCVPLCCRGSPEDVNWRIYIFFYL